MRILFFLLLLGNVALFAYNWLGSGAQAGSDAQIVGQQLDPDKIRVLLPEQVSALTRKAEPPKIAAVCLEWGVLAGGDVARAEQALEPLALGAKLSQRRQEDIAGFWVYVPPLVSRQSAESMGRPFDEEADAVMRAMIEDQIERESVAMFITGRVYDDGIIDPRDSRTVLGMALSACHSAEVRGTREWGVFRM